MGIDTNVLDEAVKRSIEVAKTLLPGFQVDSEMIAAEYNRLMDIQEKSNVYDFVEIQNELDTRISIGIYNGSVTKFSGMIVKIVIISRSSYDLPA
ncbi:hypothetical protein [Pseudomonas viridiflava]|uniref:hypothetical protein n=2 Tax=Pseudomonas viridiflava TaxID=33069 RepID=UPI000F043E0B|nr:hypothetical protein [Pseudomonas viridiflava]